MTHGVTEVDLTAEQKSAVEVARVGFMAACPFYAYYFYAEMKEVFTKDVPTAATDGRHIFINPEYLASLKPPERVFVYAHEVDHVICRDPQRMATYAKAKKTPQGTPYDQEQYNISADYVRNAGLLEAGIGMMNPSWCFASDVSGNDVVEDVYKRKFQKRPPGGGGPFPGATYGQAGKAPRGAKGDKVADAHGGRFDQVLPPPVDPVTGKVDLPTESEFKEAIARAFEAAKAMGNVPSNIVKKVGDILEPQIDWIEHIRAVVTGRIGSRHETWNKPNRRRLALNPILIMPGRRGYGADTVVVALDTSGSIYADPKALGAFWGEVGGILTDVRPRRVMLIECDATVQRVSEANTLDELEYTRGRGVKGGGGTSFAPVFDYLEREQIRPDTLIYLTDLMGTFPKSAPSYPTVWCSIMDGKVPFGDLVRIKT